MFSLNAVEEICFVSNERFEGFNQVECGNKIFNYGTLSQAKNNLSALKQKSDSFQFCLEEIELDSLFKLLKFQEIKTSEIDDIMIIYGYTPYGEKSIYLDGKKVNVQIAVRENKLIVGFPMILTGY